MTPKAHRSKNGKVRNSIIAVVAENDPTRFQSRTVHPDKGGNAKRRPRNSNRNERIFGDD